MEPGQSVAVRKASKFYGQSQILGYPKCVVTGQDNPDWHHLDESPTHWWHYLNIIPLDHSLNQELETRRFRGLPFALELPVLQVTARRHHMGGRFAQGYACARLGAFIAMPPRGDIPRGLRHDPDAALECCVAALCSARPISAIPFAIDTLQRNAMPAVKRHRSEIRSLTAARLVVEIGSYFRDQGLLIQAIYCCDLVDRLLQCSETSTEKALKARNLQHRAIAIIAADTKAPLALMDDAYCAIHEAQSYLEGFANHALWKTRAILNRTPSKLDECFALIRNIRSLQEKRQVGAWAWAETVWTDAELSIRTGHRNDAYDRKRQTNPS
jgi:hypothetical protein